MSKESEYATEWNESARYFYDRGSYDWMCSYIQPYKKVLEIGCGTGYSTLSLLENGHEVIAVDNNQYCLNSAREKIGENNQVVEFIEGDIVDDCFKNSIIRDKNFDLVICWNIGTYWSAEMAKKYYPYLIDYGLTRDDIIKSPESSYAELILWHACKIAKERNKPINIIERSKKEIELDYHNSLRKEYKYANIISNSIEATTLSSLGRRLTNNETVINKEKINITLNSITFTSE